MPRSSHKRARDELPKTKQKNSDVTKTKHSSENGTTARKEFIQKVLRDNESPKFWAHVLGVSAHYVRMFVRGEREVPEKHVFLISQALARLSMEKRAQEEWALREMMSRYPTDKGRF